jgi:hypothetical protein
MSTGERICTWTWNEKRASGKSKTTGWGYRVGVLFISLQLGTAEYLDPSKAPRSKEDYQKGGSRVSTESGTSTNGWLFCEALD